MRVAYVITKLDVGGAQETAVRCASGLRARGHDVVLVSGRAVDNPGEMAHDAIAAGLAVVEVPSLGRAIRPLRDVVTVARLARLFRSIRPDVVHTHSSKAGIVGRLAARLARVPVVVHTVHGWSFHDRMPPPVRSAYVVLERLAARWTDRLVVVTPLDRDKGLGAWIGSPADYRLIRSGIDLSTWADAGRPIGADDAPVVGTVTRLSRQKDPLTLVRAFEHIARGRPDARFVVVGDGPLRADVEAELRRLGIDDRVELVGVQRDVAPIVASFAVFVSSSLWEGLPRVIIEAMAARVPVVATAVDGVAEVVHDGTTGLLAAPSDPPALAAAALRVMNDPWLRDALVAGAAALVADFDEAAMVEAHEEMYCEVLSGRAASSPVTPSSDHRDWQHDE